MQIYREISVTLKWVEINNLKFKFFDCVYHLDDILLQRFLNVYDNKDLKKSLELLKYNLITRKNGSHIFFNRDPLSDATQTVFKST